MDCPTYLHFAHGSGTFRLPTPLPAPSRSGTLPLHWFDRYQLGAPLAIGGVGEVHRGTDRLTGQAVAIKVLRELFTRTPEVVEHFLGELEVARRVSHDGLVRIHDGGIDRAGRACIVMELVDGDELGAVLARGPLDVAAIATIGAQVADAVGALHRAQIIHCDLKPANVLVLRDRGASARPVTRVVDFGVARFLDLAQATDPSVSGTPAYMAPEQWQGQVDERTDVYALGCVLFELCTGRPPFDASSMGMWMVAHATHPVPALRPLRAEVSPALDRLVRSMLAKVPEHRPGDLGAVADQLRALAGGG